MSATPERAPDTAYLLDVIRQLVGFSRAGTLHQEDGEQAAWIRATRVLDAHLPGWQETP